MDFGLFFLMQRDEQWSEQAVYDSDMAQMLAAEALGYESVWIAEHHFNDYGLCPAPPVLASFVAARSSTIRLGMGVSLLPLHHPIDLAEQLAVLDVASGGRLDVGIGRGGTLQDYQTFRSERADARLRAGRSRPTPGAEAGLAFATTGPPRRTWARAGSPRDPRPDPTNRKAGRVHQAGSQPYADNGKTAASLRTGTTASVDP